MRLVMMMSWWSMTKRTRVRVVLVVLPIVGTLIIRQRWLVIWSMEGRLIGENLRTRRLRKTWRPIEADVQRLWRQRDTLGRPSALVVALVAFDRRSVALLPGRYAIDLDRLVEDAIHRRSVRTGRCACDRPPPGTDFDTTLCTLLVGLLGVAHLTCNGGASALGIVRCDTSNHRVPGFPGRSRG